MCGLGITPFTWVAGPSFLLTLIRLRNSARNLVGSTRLWRSLFSKGRLSFLPRGNLGRAKRSNLLGILDLIWIGVLFLLLLSLWSSGFCLKMYWDSGLIFKFQIDRFLILFSCLLWVVDMLLQNWFLKLRMAPLSVCLSTFCSRNGIDLINWKIKWKIMFWIC